MSKKEFTKQEELEIIEFHKNHSDTATAKQFHIHVKPRLLNILAKYGETLHSKEVNMKFKAENFKKTCMKKYGGPAPMSSNIIKQKTKETCLKKYGVDHVFKIDSVKDKVTETLISRYGRTNVGTFGTPEFQEAMIEKYGNIYPMQIEEKRQKIQETLLNKYGQLHAPNKKYKYEDQNFDSFPELCFYLYHIKNNIQICREPVSLEYSFEGNMHRYIPDFQVNGVLFEIKGDQFKDVDDTWCNPFDITLSPILKAKHQCAIQHNVIILYKADYQKYLDWFYKNGYKKEDFIV